MPVFYHAEPESKTIEGQVHELTQRDIQAHATSFETVMWQSSVRSDDIYRAWLEDRIESDEVQTDLARLTIEMRATGKYLPFVIDLRTGTFEMETSSISASSISESDTDLLLTEENVSAYSDALRAYADIRKLAEEHGESALNDFDCTRDLLVSGDLTCEYSDNFFMSTARCADFVKAWNDARTT